MIALEIDAKLWEEFQAAMRVLPRHVFHRVTREALLAGASLMETQLKGTINSESFRFGVGALSKSLGMQFKSKNGRTVAKVGVRRDARIAVQRDNPDGTPGKLQPIKGSRGRAPTPGAYFHFIDFGFKHRGGGIIRPRHMLEKTRVAGWPQRKLVVEYMLEKLSEKLLRAHFKKVNNMAKKRAKIPGVKNGGEVAPSSGAVGDSVIPSGGDSMSAPSSPAPKTPKVARPGRDAQGRFIKKTAKPGRDAKGRFLKKNP